MNATKRLMKVTAATAVALSLFSSVVQAACTQSRAIYQDHDDTYELTFRPQQENSLKMSPAPTNEFTITVKDKPEFKLSGVVVWPEEDIARPYALVTFNCKGNGSNPEDLDDCSVWQNVVYALKDGAEAGLLPKGDEPAAQAILLPDLVTALDGYDFGAAKPEKMLQWEVFRFRGCMPEDE